MRKKNIILLISVVVTGIMLTAGTYAFFTFSANVTNGNYSGAVECFEIDYSIDNGDGTDNITGTLWPTADASGGLSGKVAININSSCDVTGTGDLYLHVGTGTSSTLVQNVAAHCENATTLVTMDDYETSSACSSAGGTWVTSGSALKYAIYTSSDASGTPIKVGYVTNSFLDASTGIYEDFSVAHTQLNYYIYIWMDGYLVDEEYTSLGFDGYIHASVLQNE